MTTPNDADRDFGSSDCSSSSVSNPFYHTEFTTVPKPDEAEARMLAKAESMTTGEIEKELRESGVDVDAFLKRCSEAVAQGIAKAEARTPKGEVQK